MANGSEGEERIAAAFESARSDGRAALMPYMMGSYPDPEAALTVAAAYAEAGADLVELGIPFSDPLADGPVIHAAATRALEAGGSFAQSLRAVEALGEIPAVVMCYANMVMTIGPAEFAESLVTAGASGAIVPDLPLEESNEVREALSGAGLALIPLIAPTTPPERRKRICEVATGFVYTVSDVGVTGERARLPTELTALVSAAQAAASVPVAVGFGISTPEQVAEAGRIADGVIVGSRLVRELSGGSDVAAAGESIRKFLASCRAAIEQPA